MLDDPSDPPSHRCKFVGLGAGGHARVLIDLIRRCNGEVVGLLVGPADPTEEFESVPVLGTDDKLAALRTSGLINAFVAVGTTRASRHREKLHKLCIQEGFHLPPLIHPTAIVGTDVLLGPGCQLLAGTIINSGAHLADGCLVNTGAIVEHDCILEAFVHCSPGAILGGNVRVGARSHIGLGARVLQGVTIGSDVTVGAGAVVIHDVPDGECVVGIPAHPIKEKI